MAPIPEIEDFVSFADLDLRRRRCIYHIFPAKGNPRRCYINVYDEDLTKAIELQKAILECVEQDVPLKQIQQYAVVNCCRNHHQAKIEDSFLHKRLARRWQQELRSRLISTVQVTVQLASPTISTVLETSKVIVPHSTPAVAERELEPVRAVDARPHTYHLRSTVQVERVESDDEDEVGPTFKPHTVWPLQTVYDILKKPFETKDYATGSIYLFKRVTSPGFVKIGYTSGEVEDRVARWEEDCGHKLELVASFSNVPNVRRAETLVHFELFKEWRREVRCKRFEKSHIEWFEIATAEAVVTAKNWADWMRDIQPYDSCGQLSQEWHGKIHKLHKTDNAITAKRLLKIDLDGDKGTPSEVPSEPEVLGSNTVNLVKQEELADVAFNLAKWFVPSKPAAVPSYEKTAVPSDAESKQQSDTLTFTFGKYQKSFLGENKVFKDNASPFGMGNKTSVGHSWPPTFNFGTQNEAPLVDNKPSAKSSFNFDSGVSFSFGSTKSPTLSRGNAEPLRDNNPPTNRVSNFDIGTGFSFGSNKSSPFSQVKDELCGDSRPKTDQVSGLGTIDFCFGSNSVDSRPFASRVSTSGVYNFCSGSSNSQSSTQFKSEPLVDSKSKTSRVFALGEIDFHFGSNKSVSSPQIEDDLKLSKCSTPLPEASLCLADNLITQAHNLDVCHAASDIGAQDTIPATADSAAAIPAALACAPSFEFDVVENSEVSNVVTLIKPASGFSRAVTPDPKESTGQRKISRARARTF